MGDVLTLKEATVRRNGRNILDSVTWDVNEGERWVILGPRRVLGRGEGYAAQPRDGGGNEYGVDDDAEPELPIPEQHQKHG